MQINEDFLAREKLVDIGRWFITNFVAEVAGALPPGSRLLDAGAGEGVYRRLFSHCEYKAIDLAVGESKWDYSHLDYIGPLHDMPVESDSFDAVLCTQVLEHLEWPRESVREMRRVLKPGGALYMTLPMAHGEHQQPYDFFRYTSYGVRSICQDAGFSSVEVQPFGGFPIRMAYELPALGGLFPPARQNGSLNPVGIALLPVRAATRMMIRATQKLLLWADQFDHQRSFPFGWAVVARK